MHRKTSILFALALSLFIIILVAYAVTTYTHIVPNKGKVASSAKIKLFFDENCLNEHLSESIVDWGNLSIGSNYNYWWIKNTGNCNVTLNLTIDSIPSTWVLNWNYTSEVIRPTQIIHVTITLTVPEETLAGDYTWQYRIIAEEAFL